MARKDSLRTGKRGGNKKNQNSRTHGLFATFPWKDKRTNLNKAFREKLDALSKSFGRVPNSGELILLERVASKSLQIEKFEEFLFSENGEPKKRYLQNIYLKYCASLRADLQTLGLNEKVLERTPSVQSSNQVVFVLPDVSQKTDYKQIAEQNMKGIEIDQTPRKAIPLPAPASNQETKTDSTDSEKTLKPLEIFTDSANREQTELERERSEREAEITRRLRWKAVYLGQDESGMTLESSRFAEATRLDYDERMKRSKKRERE